MLPFFKSKYNVDILTEHQVLNIYPKDKYLEVKNLSTSDVFIESYDKLVISTGADSNTSNKGIEKNNVFVLRNVGSADRIKSYIVQRKPQKALIIGSGFIGLEMAENLKSLGMEVAVVETEDHLMKPLDRDVSQFLKDILLKNGVEVYLTDGVQELEGTKEPERLCSKAELQLRRIWLLLQQASVPNVELAGRAGVELGITGAIKVDSRMATNIKRYLCMRDCAESYSLVTNKPIYRPLALLPTKWAELPETYDGGDLEFRGILGTGIFKYSIPR
jgi:NADPH-dependent 2,4-dienoyl-CoA reductase/sulfur reductase-like enzyme